jgi:hypothetical protein
MRPIVCSLLLALAGCDAQVDSSYAGEPQLQITATAAGFTANELAGSAAILWNRNIGVEVPFGPLIREPLRAKAPSGVIVDVMAPPPPEVFFGFTGETATIAEGYPFLVRAGAGEPLSSEALIGTTLDVVLVFVRGTVEPGSLTAAYLGGVRASGYHLLARQATAELSTAQRALVDQCVAGLRPDALAACRWPRLYQLTDATSEPRFFRHFGGP